MVSACLPAGQACAVSVSVVIPTYNRGYILRNALDAALAQTHKNFEILVVDDGSVDNTREIVESYKSDQIRYIRHERNLGCSAGYNTGIRSARGSLVAFLDSDDRWEPEYLECLVGFLCRHPQVDVVFCDTKIEHASGSVTSLMSEMRVFPALLQKRSASTDHVIAGREMYLCLLEEVPIKPTATIVRRTLFDRIGVFDEAWPSGTDWDLFFRMSRVATFGYVDRALAFQKRMADATHRLFLEKDKLFLLKIFAQEKSSIDRDSETLKKINRGISGLYNSLGWYYLESGRRGEALLTYLRGAKETRRPVLVKKFFSAVFRIAFFPSGPTKQQGDRI